MDPVILFALAVVVLLIVLRIFFKLAKVVLFLGLLIAGAVLVWNVMVRQ